MHEQARPIPEKLNTLVILLQLSLLALCFAGARTATGWKLALLASGFGLLMNSVYSILHEAEHRILFRSLALNEAAGTLMALFFPAPFHLLRQGHLGHHMRNRSDDEAFDLYFDDDSRLWKFTVMYGILTGLYWLFVVAGNIAVLCLPFFYRKDFWSFDRASQAFLQSYNWKYQRLIQLEAVLAIALHTSLVWFLHIPFLHYCAIYGAFGSFGRPCNTCITTARNGMSSTEPAICGFPGSWTRPFSTTTITAIITRIPRSPGFISPDWANRKKDWPAFFPGSI